MDKQKLRERLCALAREAGEIILAAEENPETKNKLNKKDFVTKYDRAVQDFLEEHLRAEYPEVGYLAEEGDDFGHTDVTHPLFVIDPIDGTTNFVRGLRQSAVSIAYTEDAQSIVGVVYLPYSGETFYAVRGEGAFLDGRPIRVSDDALSESIVSVGTAVYYAELMASTCALLSAVLPRVVDIRRTGSAAIDLCYTAAGRFGAFVEDRLCPWDYAAGALILTEAGGIATDYEGRPLPLDQKPTILCGNPRAYAELREIVKTVKY